MKNRKLLLALSISCALFPLQQAAAADNQTLEQRVSELEAQLKATQEKVNQNEQVAKEANDKASSFEFHGYARAGLNINQNFQGAHGGRSNTIGPQMSIASGLGAYFGRLGLEDDNYVDSRLTHYQQAEDGTKSMYQVMLSAGDETETDWVSASSSSLNVRQLYLEMSDIAAFKDSDAFAGSTLWAGKRYDRENFDIDFIDTHVIFLTGTGLGIYDVKMGDNWRSNFSIIGNQFDADSGTSYDLEGYTFTWNNLIDDHWEIMFNAIAANKNDQRASLDSAVNRNDVAQYGLHTMIGYKTDSFYGLKEGWSRTGMMYGHAMGAETKNIGQDNHLLKDANSVRFYTVGATPIFDSWRIAPSLLSELTKDRYLKGDEYKWAVFNVRLAQEFNPNFEIAYEGTYQYLDLDNTSKHMKGNVYKATIAPTFKISNVAGFFDRPQIRFAVSYINWSDKFEGSYYINGVDCGMGENSETVFAVQMETWF
ncbi:carbohydrate porin [Vibrio tritonius]|uniref:carbohydrate porin n=1 Tax=Vibrio tritonius TaxID=1435069 RepID=UPI00315D7C91